jgi:dolichol-phosphate mannosyltransferase
MAKNMVKNDFKFSIVIPTYKENENLIKLIPLIYKILNTNKFNFELIIIDDDSRDGTTETYHIFKKKFKNIHLVVRKNKVRDLSLSCICGFELSKFKNILVMDADMQHNPNYLKLLVKRFSKEKIDFLVACRDFTNKSKVKVNFTRFFLSKIIIILFNFLLGFKTNDPMSGFFIFKKKIFVENKKKLFARGYKILADLIYSSKNKLKIKDQFIIFNQRDMNSSKLNFKILLLILILLFRGLLRRFNLINSFYK